MAIPATLTDSGESTPAAISERRSKEVLKVEFRIRFLQIQETKKGRRRRSRRRRRSALFVETVFALCVSEEQFIFVFAFWFGFGVKSREGEEKACLFRV